MRMTVKTARLTPAAFDNVTADDIHAAIQSAKDNAETNVKRIVQGTTWIARLTDGKTLIHAPLNLSLRQLEGLEALDDESTGADIMTAIKGLIPAEDYDRLMDAPATDAAEVVRLYMTDLAEFNGATLGE